ncbi:MAG: hypothetical protein ACI91O_000542 [Candidatus Poriferisodalaceae bacterium]|jgi:hypothetical protein
MALERVDRAETDLAPLTKLQVAFDPPDGLHGPSMIDRPPYNNTAVLADNEYTLHRVGPIGRPEYHVADDGIPFDAKLALTESFLRRTFPAPTVPT